MKKCWYKLNKKKHVYDHQESKHDSEPNEEVLATVVRFPTPYYCSIGKTIVVL